LEREIEEGFRDHHIRFRLERESVCERKEESERVLFLFFYGFTSPYTLAWRQTFASYVWDSNDIV
jgi:hypothetical protein